MRILALETTDNIGSVAAIADDNPLSELMLDHTQRSAQSLLPAVDSLLKQVGWLPADVQLVAVSIGPGSFTGLRVGVTAAKVFAYAVGAEVLGVNTLEAIAANCADTRCNEVSVVIDAQRGQLVVQSFARQTGDRFEPVGAEELLDADAWLARLQVAGSRQLAVGSGQSAVNAPPPSALRLPPSSNPQSPIPNPSLVTGPGLVRLLDHLPAGVAVLDQSFWRPRAAGVGRLAARHYAQGRRDDLWRLVPHYYRRSAAEEKWDARGLSQFSQAPQRSCGRRKWDCPP